MKILSSYVSCRNINGICIPLPIQTNYLRSYANNKNMILSMPNVEWTNSKSYSKLITLINDKNIQEIAICSIFMVNFDEIEPKIKNAQIFKEFHFPLENKIFNLEESFEYYKTYIKLRKLSKNHCNFI